MSNPQDPKTLNVAFMTSGGESQSQPPLAPDIQLLVSRKSNCHRRRSNTKVAVHFRPLLLLSSGLAPCLAASISSLVSSYYFLESTTVTVRLYKHGYVGILTGDSITLSADQVRGNCQHMYSSTNVCIALFVLSLPIRKPLSPVPLTQYHTRTHGHTH
jgi:hypothetical protein